MTGMVDMMMMAEKQKKRYIITMITALLNT